MSVFSGWWKVDYYNEVMKSIKIMTQSPETNPIKNP